ncbi:hypothetical protein BDY24DRAFT_419074 [Mrakia frigida]|uniref:F-box protein n=1 Tax=Mrakia frigida TaxID=29902 RepID=UPI003FCC1BF8
MQSTIQTTVMAKGRCQLLELPTEMILHSLGFLDTDDLLSVALTCKALRAVSCSIYYWGLEVDISNPIRLELLRARADDPCVASAVKELVLSTTGQPPPIEPSLLDLVLYALEKMPNLYRIILPPWLLVGSILNAFRTNSSVAVIQIGGLVNRSTFSLDAFSLPSSSVAPPPRPLAFELKLGVDNDRFGSELLSCFNRAGDTISYASVSLDSPIVPPFLIQLLPNLIYLDIVLDPATAETILPWTSTLSALYPTVEAISIDIRKEKDGEEEDPTFFLSRANWINIPGSVEELVEEFLNEWSEISFEQVSIDQKLDGDGELSRVAFVLDECILSRPMVVSLAQVVGAVRNLVLEPRYWNASFGWQDWDTTLSAFDAFTSLRILEFLCTVTPSPTLNVVIGCKSECLDLMYQLLPSLKTDLPLVGGLSGLRNLETGLNVQRLERLAPHLPTHTEVLWDFGGDEPMAYRLGWVECDEEGKKSLELKEVGKRTEEGGEESRPPCLICDQGFEEDTEQMTPIDSLLEFPVEEVRSALAFGGMDLDAFDSRPLNFYKTPFERFLRPVESLGLIRLGGEGVIGRRIELLHHSPLSKAARFFIDDAARTDSSSRDPCF